MMVQWSHDFAAASNFWRVLSPNLIPLFGVRKVGDKLCPYPSVATGDGLRTLRVLVEDSKSRRASSD